MSLPVTRTVSSPSRTRGNLVPPDKGAVILDIGHVYTRIGFSGEPAPRHVIPSTVSMKPYGEVLDVWDRKYINREELFLILCRFLSKVYLQYLMANPRDYRVVVVESILAPSNFRNLLAKALFAHFGVPNVCFLPHYLACLFTVGRSTALVVDIGFNESSVIPVFEGVPLIKSIQITSCATTSLYSSLQKLLEEYSTVHNVSTKEIVSFSSITDLLTPSVLADIIVKTRCFVRPLNRGDDVPLDVIYPLGTQYTLTITGYIRCHVADILCEDTSDDLSLPVCLLEALLQCPMDCRHHLSENIIVVGGNAGLPGLNWRLNEEILLLLSDDNKHYNPLHKLSFKFHSLPSLPNYTAWQGASILGNIELSVLERSVSREEFNTKGQKLPEWMSCDFEQWERLRQVSPRKHHASPVQPRIKLTATQSIQQKQ